MVRLGKSQRNKEPTVVASVAAFNPDGLLLLGKRNDPGKWVLPGGHSEPDETHQRTAIRELFEESGLPAKTLEYLGQDTVHKGGHDIVVHCYRADVDGEPTGKHDPDEECSHWEWVDASDGIPEKYDLRDRPNCTLVRLGIEASLSKAQKNWRSREGITIPTADNPERRHWNDAFEQHLKEVFGSQRGQDLQPIKVPVEQLQGMNMPVNQDRLRLYRRMAAAGEQLPPIVVRRSGKGFNVIDGNHRLAAAQARGVTHLNAYEILDPVKKALKDIPVGPRVKFQPEEVQQWRSLTGGSNPWKLDQGLLQGAVHDYSHVLKPEHRQAGYRLRVYHAPRVSHPDLKGRFPGHRLEAKLFHGDQYAGGIQALVGHEDPVDPGVIDIGHSRLRDEHRGKGLGLALYEALLAHGKNKLGASHVSGDAHSTLASRVHQKLSERHGMGYEPEEKMGPSESKPTAAEFQRLGIEPKSQYNYAAEAFDERFAPYQYALKQEVAPTDIGLEARGYQFGIHHLKDRTGQVHTTTVSVTHPDEYKRSGDDKVGAVDFEHTPDEHLVASQVWVHERHQRQGIARRMYQLATEAANKPIRPSSLRTQAGANFWLGKDELDFNKKENAEPGHSDEDDGILPSFQERDSLVLEKALWPSLLTAATLATSPVQAQVPGAEIQPQAQQVQQIEQKWTPHGLDRELKPIAHLESGFGRNTNHEPHSGGPYHTAYGALGLKPVTAHETYKHSPRLQKLFPGLDSPEKVIEKMKDPQFYNIVASGHWRYLKRVLGDPLKAAYGWRWGLGAAQHADDYQIKTEPYVQKYGLMMAAKLGQAVISHLMEKTELTKSEQDHLMTLLDHDDRLERRLALKHKSIKPFHLRHALHDEDPEIRALAAAHPAMTDELLTESLYHDDPMVRETLARRPDLQAHHLDVLLWDPATQALASRHPALTEEQRQKLVEHPQTPAGLREEVLRKNIGFLLYPNFGLKQVPTQPMILGDRKHRENRYLLQATRLTGKKAPAAAQVKAYLRAARTGGSMLYNTMPDAPTPSHWRTMGGFVNPETNLNLHGNVGHESQHGVYGQLSQNIGQKGMREVVDKTIGSLDEKHRQALDKIMATKRYAYTPEQAPEENLAYVHNYLQDPVMRAGVHRHHGLNEQESRELVQDVRRAWQQMQRYAQTLKPKDIGPHIWADPKLNKTEELRDWAKHHGVDLTKRSEVLLRDPSRGKPEEKEDLAQDLMGFSEHADAVMAAAKFLSGGKEIDEEEFRRYLWVHDNDIETAALAAYGLEINEANLKALKGLLEIRDLGKKEKIWDYDPHVVAAVPEGEKTAREVEAALRAGNVKQLELKGKHSKGALMVWAPHGGDTYLLKPGSGKPSPAKGVKEERATQSQREAAFAHVARNWDLEQYLPSADLIIIEDKKDGQKVIKEYAAIKFLGIGWKNLDKTRSKTPNLGRMAMTKYLRNGSLHKWAALDGILGNPDRHSQNLMISNEEMGSRLMLIDHGSAFAGQGFDPVHDESSFTPYYLRIWNSDSRKNFNLLNPEERFKVMPRTNHFSEDLLRVWLQGISEHELESTLLRYGLNPGSEVARLQKLKALAAIMPVDEAINRLWSGLDSWGDSLPNIQSFTYEKIQTR